MANMNAKFMKNAFIGWTDTHGLYYPTDFDPSKLVSEKKYNREKRNERKNNKGPKMMEIRMMFPFSMICNTCGNFSYVGTKFNSQVEKVSNEAYYGCAIYRFYGKCQHCGSAFTFKTDPESADYVMESGGRRNYEAWKDADGAIESVAKSKEEEAEYDNMKALEQASESAAAEMQIADALEELQQLNKRTKNHDDTILQAIDFLYKKHAAEAKGADNLGGENFEEELEEYRNEQLSRKRQTLDEEIADQDVSASTSSSSSSAPVPDAQCSEASENERKKSRIERLAPDLPKKMSPPPPIIVKKKMAAPVSIIIKRKGSGDPSEAPGNMSSLKVDKLPDIGAVDVAVDKPSGDLAAGGPLLSGYDSESSSA